MYKIGVVGDRDSIYGFAALGLSIYPVIQVEEAVGLLRQLSKENFAIIYITERLYSQVQSEIEVYGEQLLPAIIPIPGVLGNTGCGIGGVKKCVERAVGSDIIFNNQNQ